MKYMVLIFTRRLELLCNDKTALERDKESLAAQLADAK